MTGGRLLSFLLLRRHVRSFRVLSYDLCNFCTGYDAEWRNGISSGSYPEDSGFNFRLCNQHGKRCQLSFSVFTLKPARQCLICHSRAHHLETAKNGAVQKIPIRVFHIRFSFKAKSPHILRGLFALTRHTVIFTAWRAFYTIF